MKYTNMKEAVFLERLNRFVAVIELEGQQVKCHVKNTGRCKELLIPGTRIYVQESDKAERKTKYDLIGVEKGTVMVNMDSQIPNKVVQEWLEKGKLINNLTLIRPETRYKNSRFDFYLETAEQKIFMEVKGVTLEEEGVARFPDAPTERGVKHIKELQECMKEGYQAYIVFVIQMKNVYKFMPNDITHPAFGKALREASKSGVSILVYDCQVTSDTILLDQEIPLEL